MRCEYATPQIAIGGAMNTREAYDQMQSHLDGITHIICLTRLCQHRFDDTPKAEILHYYMPDDGKFKPYRYWAACVEFALDVLENPHSKLLIHCAAGRNRSTSVAYAVLRCKGNYQSWEAEKAILRYADIIHKRDTDYPPLSSIKYKADVDLFYTRWKVEHK